MKPEAQKLWREIQALERDQPPEQADAAAKEAFFRNKNKKMQRLKEAFEKADGIPTGPNQHRHNQLRGEREILDDLRINLPDNDPRRDYAS